MECTFNQLLLQFSQVTHWLLLCALLHGVVVPWKPHMWHSAYIKLFKRNQSAIKCRCILWKIIHNVRILTKLCQLVLGLRFLWNTVYFRASAMMCRLHHFSTTETSFALFAFTVFDGHILLFTVPRVCWPLTILIAVFIDTSMWLCISPECTRFSPASLQLSTFDCACIVDLRNPHVIRNIPIYNAITQPHINASGGADVLAVKL